MSTNLAILLVVLGAFSSGAALIGLCSLLPQTRPRAAEIWPLFASELVIVGGLLVPAGLGGWFFVAYCAAFVVRGQYEMFALHDMPAWGGAQLLALAGAGLTLIGAAISSEPALWAAFVAGLWLCLIAALIPPWRRAAPVAAATLVFPALMLALAMRLRAGSDGFVLIVLAYAVVEINDAFALVVGKLFGKSPILPRLSPKKTGAGLFGGLTAGILAGYGLAHGLFGFAPGVALALVLAALLAGLAGDLATSALKRAFGKKDFAAVFAAHGGVLDIYDSFLFAAPAVYVVAGLMR